MPSWKQPNLALNSLTCYSSVTFMINICTNVCTLPEYVVNLNRNNYDLFKEGEEWPKNQKWQRK